MIAVYIINLLSCRGNKKCPEEVWSNIKSSLNHIRVFGCKAMVRVPKEKRTKLSDKSVEYIL